MACGISSFTQDQRVRCIHIHLNYWRKNFQKLFCRRASCDPWSTSDQITQPGRLLRNVQMPLLGKSSVDTIFKLWKTCLKTKTLALIICKRNACKRIRVFAYMTQIIISSVGLRMNIFPDKLSSALVFWCEVTKMRIGQRIFLWLK